MIRTSTEGDLDRLVEMGCRFRHVGLVFPLKAGEKAAGLEDQKSDGNYAAETAQIGYVQMSKGRTAITPGNRGITPGERW